MLAHGELGASLINVHSECEHVPVLTRRTSWLGTGMLITGELIGAGVMGLPYAASKLGWVVSIGPFIDS